MEAQNREPELLKKVIERWLKRTGLESWKKYKAFALWNEAIKDDENLLKHTFPHRFFSQRLEVLVDSPVHYYELINFRKLEILKKIQDLSENILYIKDICFQFKDPDKKI